MANPATAAGAHNRITIVKASPVSTNGNTRLANGNAYHRLAIAAIGVAGVTPRPGVYDASILPAYQWAKLATEGSRSAKRPGIA